MNNIWITSDWHFCHNRNFLYEPRGFNTVEDMNEEIIRRHNSVVGKDDIVYCLGDCILSDTKCGLEYIKRLNGQIKLILGNHDGDTRAHLYGQLPNVEVLGFGARLKYKHYNFFLTHYPTLVYNFDKEKPLKKQIINLCGHSYPPRSW